MALSVEQKALFMTDSRTGQLIYLGQGRYRLSDNTVVSKADAKESTDNA